MSMLDHILYPTAFSSWITLFADVNQVLAKEKRLNQLLWEESLEKTGLTHIT